MQFWNELEGQVLDGIYPLHRLVRSEGRTAWFETSTGDNADQLAIISVIESLTDTDEVLERLHAAQNLNHPNLLAISKIGKARVEDTPVLYALMEHADQNLSDVLREQTLSREDAGQVAEALIGALTAIHQQGLVHGRVEAASVFAVGDSVKLRSDCMQSPGGTRAGDIAGIGAILFQAFTQRKAPLADDPQINRIPAPFSEIVRKSLSARWSLAQIASALKPGASGTAATTPQPSPARAGSAPRVGPAAATEPRPPAPAKPPAKPATTESTPPVREGAVPAVKAAPQTPAPPRLPVQPQSAVPPPSATGPRSQGQPAPVSKKPLTLYAAIGLVVLLILGWLIFRPKSQAPSASNASSAAAPATSPAPAQPPATNPPASKPSAIPAPAGMHATTPTAARSPGARTVWRVVAYTYNQQDRAQKKVDEIARQHSDLQVSVFAPHGNRAPYFVTIGGPMDRDHAFEVRDQARRMGLPSDTYAQNFSE